MTANVDKSSGTATKDSLLWIAGVEQNHPCCMAIIAKALGQGPNILLLLLLIYSFKEHLHLVLLSKLQISAIKENLLRNLA